MRVNISNLGSLSLISDLGVFFGYGRSRSSGQGKKKEVWNDSWTLSNQNIGQGPAGGDFGLATVPRTRDTLFLDRIHHRKILLEFPSSFLVDFSFLEKGIADLRINLERKGRAFFFTVKV